MSDEIELHSFATEQPRNGSRFVAFYCDGSGASLFMRDDSGNYIDAEGNLILDDDLSMDSWHCWFSYLPDSFKQFFEHE